MNIEIKPIDLSNKKDLNAFVDFPWKIYKDDPKWVPPLKMAVKDVLNVKKHPFYETARVQAFLAYKNNEIVGRILAVNNFAYNEYINAKIGFFGFYETINDQKVSDSLLNAAVTWIKKEGLDSLQGPMNPGTNYECGLLVKGFDDEPVMMMTYNPPYYETLLNNYGLHKSMDLLAYDSSTNFQMPKIIKDIAERTMKKEHVTVRNVNMKKWKDELELMFEIYNSAWEKNWGFVPMTKKEFFHTAKDLKSIVDPSLIQIAEVNGEPAGFILNLPDLNQVFKQIPSGELSPMAIYKILTAKKRMNRCRVITMGVKAKFRKMGIETVLYSKNQDSVLAGGRLNRVEMSWILESNVEMNKPMIRMGAVPYKTYRILEKKI